MTNDHLRLTPWTAELYLGKGIFFHQKPSHFDGSLVRSQFDGLEDTLSALLRRSLIGTLQQFLPKPRLRLPGRVGQTRNTQRLQ